MRCHTKLKDESAVKLLIAGCLSVSLDSAATMVLVGRGLPSSNTFCTFKPLKLTELCSSA